LDSQKTHNTENPTGAGRALPVAVRQAAVPLKLEPPAACCLPAAACCLPPAACRLLPPAAFVRGSLME